MMYDTPDFARDALAHLLLTLAVGAAIMVLFACLVERFIRRAAVHRALWQTVLLGFGGLLIFEWTGMGQAVSGLLSRPETREVTQAKDTAEMAGSASVVADDSSYDAETFGGLSKMGTGSEQEEPDPAQYALMQGAFPLLQQADGGELSLPQNQDIWQFEVPSGGRDLVVEDFAVPPVEAENVSTLTPEAADASTALVLDQPVRPASELADNTKGLATWGFALLWLAGAAYFAGRTAVVRLRLTRVRRQWQHNADPELGQLVDDLRQRIGMGRTIRTGVAEGLPGPVAFGIFRPTILVPADFARRFSPHQQEVILAHELAHLAGSDPAWLLLGELIVALLWWHPLVHLARRRLLAASEQAADEASLLVPNGPDVLAECLVKLGRRLTGKSRLGWVAAEGTGLRSGLARRIQRLLKLSDRSTSHVGRRLPAGSKPIAVLLLMVLTITCTLWVRPETSYAKGEDTMNVLKGSWRQSLAAVALTAFLSPLATDAAADESPDQPPKPAQLEDGSPADQVLLTQRGDRERGEREARDDHQRHERGERERDVEHRERGEREREVRERAERERVEHDEAMMEELQHLRQRAEEIEHEKAEFQREAEEGARGLEKAMRETQQERERNARHIAEMEEQLAKLKKQVQQEREKAREEAIEAMEEEAGKLSDELERARDVRAELAKRAENLEREMAEHRGNVERRMAELEHEFGEVRSHLERMERGREDRERGEIMRRISEIVRETAEFRRAGKHEEVERLQAEMRELRAHLAGPHDRDRPERREAARREGMERLEALERELLELREAGRHDAAERVEVELHTLQRRLAAREGDRPGPPPELQAKMEHLHVAMENLRAAGLHDQAEQIAEQIERLSREFVPGPPERREPRGPREEGRPDRGGEIVDQLRGKMEQLRRENEEMRRMIQELREAQERFINEMRERR